MAYFPARLSRYVSETYALPTDERQAVLSARTNLVAAVGPFLETAPACVRQVHLPVGIPFEMHPRVRVCGLRLTLAPLPYYYFSPKSPGPLIFVSLIESAVCGRHLSGDSP